MQILNFIIHYIQKDQFHEPSLKLNPSKPDSPGEKENELIQGFVQSAANMFDRQKSGKIFADVKKDQNTFSEVLDSYLDRDMKFPDFSVRLARELETHMKGVSLATGGYMAVAEYTGSPRKLLILMIKQEVGYAVDPATLKLRESVHLDLGSINVGARIDLDAYRAGEAHPLALVRGLKDLAKYFQNFIGVVNFKSAQEETRDLANVMEKFFLTDKVYYTKEKTAETKRSLAEFIKNSKDKTVPLMTLAGIVRPDNPQSFHDFANDAGVSVEMQTCPEVLKGWLRVSYSNQNLKLDFDKKLLDQDISWKPDSDRLAINVSKFPGLKEKLEQATQ